MRSSNAHQRFITNRSTFLALVAAFLIAGDALAQCRVEGTLFGVDRAPIAGATVRLRGPEQATPMIATTGADGRYGFDNVKAGTRVEIVAMQSGRTVAREFALVTLWVETVDLHPEPAAATEGASDLDPEGGPAAEIRGVVRTADGTAVAGATVAITDTTVVTTTDSAGRYSFTRLRSGLALELSAAADGFQSATSQALVPSSDHVDANFTLDAVNPSRAVDADRSAPAMPSGGESGAMRPQDVAGIPTVGSMDLFRTIQFLPGVVGSLEASSELYVRGGTPDQTRISYDGFTMYPLPNALGRLAALNMNAIDEAVWSPRGNDADDGAGLGGSLRLKGAANARRPAGSIGASMLGLEAFVSTPVSDRASFLLAGRHSPTPSMYDDLLDRTDGSSTSPQHGRVARYSGGTFGLNPEASFHDLNGKATLRISSADRVAFSVYDGAEGANLSHDIPLPASPPGTLAEPSAGVLGTDAIAQVSQVERWTGRGLSGVWDRRWSSALTSTLSVGHSEFSRDGAGSSLLASASTGEDLSFVAARGGSGGLAETNRIQDTTVRLTNTATLGFAHVVSVGGEIASLESAYDAQTEVFGRTADGTYTSSLASLLARSSTGRTASVYGQDAWRPRGNLTISPAARLTRNGLASATYLDPRVGASYAVGRWIVVTGDWSVDHQAANRIVREDLSRGDGEFWALADGSTIPVPRARQLDVGASITIPGLVWEAHVFDKSFDDLTMFAPRLFPGTTISQSGGLLHYGTGRAVGLETILRYRNEWNAGWASYTAGRVEYTYPTLEAATFPASFDQAGELKIADNVRVKAYSLGAVWVFGSGRPDTPVETAVDQVWYPFGATAYRATFGPKNSDRFPPYHRLDASAGRDLHLRAVTVGLRATLFNVYDRQNIAYHEYETVGTTVTTNDVLLMRRTLDVAVKVGF